LKHEWGMLPLLVRRLARARLHVDLAILAKLTFALLAIRASGILPHTPPQAGTSACPDSGNRARRRKTPRLGTGATQTGGPAGALRGTLRPRTRSQALFAGALPGFAVRNAGPS